MIQDVTALLDKEEGSPFDYRSALFGNYDDGEIFDYGEFMARDRAEMFDRDGKAVAIRAVLSLPILSTPYTIEKGQAKQEVQDLVLEALTKPANNGGMSTPIELVIAQMCSAFVYKKSFHEKVFTIKEIGGKERVVYDKLGWRPAGTCALARDAETGAFRGFRQMPQRMDDTEEVRIKADRALVYVHGQHIDPLEGTSELEIAYWCYQTKQKIRFLWYSFLEGQALPKTIVKNRDIEQAKKTAKQLLGLRNGGIAAVEGDSTIDSYESSGKGAAEFAAALKWLDSEASNSVLAGFMDLSSHAASGKGSLALAKEAGDFFLMAETAKTREIQATINNYLIPDLVHYNFGPDEICPEWTFGELQQDKVDQSITMLQALATAPADRLPDEFFHELCIKVAGFLEMDVDKITEGLAKAAKEAELNPPVAGLPPAVAKVAGAVGAATSSVISGRPPAPARTATPAA